LCWQTVEQQFNPALAIASAVMPKLKMKTLLTNILLLVSTNLWSQTDLGIGLVSINFDDKTTLHFYSDSIDKEPKRTIQFFNDQTIKSWNIRDLDKHKEWLNPETLWLDYSSFVFRCLTVKDNWLKVIVNNESGESLWLKKSDLTTFKEWEIYLKEMFGVARLPDEQQKIRDLPTDNSDEIKYQGQDCFQVKSMKGDWIEIFTAVYCDESYPADKTKIKSGWIKWRKRNKLLNEYFITN
jgi:hypothetical protein